jgi:hypothetical protein
MVFSKRKPIVWCWFILFLSALYLLPEIVFNAKLVEVSATSSTAENDNALYHIELFGRAISGIGVSLLVLDLMPAVLVATFIRAVATITLVFCSVWPTVFFGQKYLVDTYIVDTSTPEERQQATMSSFFKLAVVENYAAIKGVDLTKQGASELTFMSILSGLVFVSDDIRNLISQKKEQIATAYVKNRSVDDSKRAIEKHNQLFKNLSQQYQTQYLPASDRVDNAGNNSEQQLGEIRLERINAVRSAYDDYQNYRKSHLARAEARAREYSPDIVKYFTKYNKRCIKKSKKETYLSAECEASIGADYKITIQKAGYGYIPPDYWLLEQEGSSRYVDGDIKFYRDRFLALPAMKQEFSQKTGGYPEGIESLSEFEQHPLTKNKVVQRLKAQGLDIRSIDQLDDDQELLNVIAKSSKSKANESWNKEMKKLGFAGMPPGLSWKEFESHPAVQKKLKQEMGNSYVSGLKASWSENTFYQKIIEPKVQNEIKKLNTFISANAASFADGGEHEELGKSAIRAAVIPPISMLLSLFLICTTLLKLPFKLIECIQLARESEIAPWLRTLAIVTPVCLAVVGPLYLHNSIYLKEGSTSYALVSKIEESHPLQWYGLYWLLHAQPMMQPLGHSINESIGIYPFNDRFLKRWDRKFMPED